MPWTAFVRRAILSLAFTGNIAVIKTRNGYAGGLAYDIDEISSPLLLGTIAGADTVFVALAEDASRNVLFTLFSAILPANVIAESKQNFS